MNATDIDKIRKKIVREGFKPDKGGSNRYRQYISNKSINPGSIMKELIYVTILLAIIFLSELYVLLCNPFEIFVFIVV